MAGFGVPATRPTVLCGPDDVSRCSWATETGMDLTAYHDREWGTATHDEATMFEALTLTFFENGLSWATVYRKREAFRLAFLGFSPTAVAAMTDRDVATLMDDRSIVRNRAKIEATIHNARLLDSLSLAKLAWNFRPQSHHRLRIWSDGRMDSPESRQLAAALKSAGFRFVGPVVAHSFMQTVGIENGHFEGCFRAPALDKKGSP
jgi:DNA-3-methyladenine glycosylase I